MAPGLISPGSNGRISGNTEVFTNTHTTLTAPGTTNWINSSGAIYHTFGVTVAAINTSVSLSLEGSIDGTNFFKLPLESVTNANLTITANVVTIDANGTYLVYVKEVPAPYIRLNFISEVGGTAVTLAVSQYSLTA